MLLSNQCIVPLVAAVLILFCNTASGRLWKLQHRQAVGQPRIEVSETVREKYLEAYSGDLLYVVAKISDDKEEVILDETFDPPFVDETTYYDEDDNRAHFNQLRESLLDDEPRYVLFDFRFTNSDGRDVAMLAFINWIPEDTLMTKKMLHASTTDGVKDVLETIVEFEAENRADFDYADFKAEVERKA